MSGGSAMAIPTPLNRDPAWQRDYCKVQQFLNGNKLAWDELYQQAYPLAVKMAWKANLYGILDQSDIQDIVSEAFARIRF